MYNLLFFLIFIFQKFVCEADSVLQACLTLLSRRALHRATLKSCLNADGAC